ncbi:uncharacterized protein LOC130445018 [Diorhabda sublineata]|uniref:uncharacterized protein LOC130445018 n=1 Tax=Diorhabda sublineata TaxID=1163346 RepID=UPI0024E15125|nr:uncharacterized protein LOC130445018 [Diorhabda sublineata]
MIVSLDKQEQTAEYRDCNSESYKSSVWMFWKARRYIVTLLVFLGLLSDNALRVNISVAIVAMTQMENVTLANGTTISESNFDWNMKMQSFILSSSYYGFLFTQLMGGYLSARFGGKLVFAIGVAGVSILTLLTPIAAKTNVYFLIVVGLFKGVFAGPLFPCANYIFAKWAPTSEKSRLVTIGFSGAYAGTLISFPISSILATYLGWESVFYVLGVFGCVWTVLWLVMVSDSPSRDSKISQPELLYITKHLEETEKEKLIVPWIKIFTSVPVWALTIAVGCKAWGYFALLSHLPTFVKHCLNYDLKDAGFVSAAPYLAMVILIQLAGHLSDFIETRKLLTRTLSRKLMISSGLLTQCIFMVLVVHWLSVFGSNFCLIMSIGLGGFTMAVITINPLDLSPNYGSIIGGMIHTCGTISAILSPTITGYIVTEQTDVDQWRIVFYIGGLIYFFGAVILSLSVLVICSRGIPTKTTKRKQDLIFFMRTCQVKRNNHHNPKQPETHSSSWMFWKTKRYLVACLSFFGFFNVYALRVNLSVAIVDMTQAKNVTLEDGRNILKQEFDWDSKLQGYILSSFFYGYITTQIIGGYIAARFGGKRIFVLGIGITALLTIFTPIIAKTNVYFLIGVRIIEGIFEGVTVPAIQAVWAVWAPPLERSRLVTFSYSGTFVGTVFAMPVCSLLASLLGWESIFYFFGTIGLIWCIFWLLMVSNSPAEDSSINAKELEYIQSSISDGKIDDDDDRIPWIQMLTCRPFWAIAVANISETWGFYTLLTYLPKIMKNVLGFDLNAAGFISALPYLAMAVILQAAGQIADHLLVKKLLTVTQVRKLLTCLGFLAQTIFILIAAFWMTRIGTTFCLVMAVGLGGCAFAGFGVNSLDIAPKFASIIIGISNTFGTIPGIVSPILTGYLVTHQEDINEWRVIFYISSSIYLFGAIFFAFNASSVLQPWAQSKKKEKELNGQNISSEIHDNASYQKDLT